MLAAACVPQEAARAARILRLWGTAGERGRSRGTGVSVPTARRVDGRVLGRNGPLARPRARPRDRRSRVLRCRRRRHQRVHGRVPGAEPGPRAGRGRRALFRLRADLHGAAGEGGEGAGLARRVEPDLDPAPGPDRGHRVVRARGAVDHGAVRLHRRGRRAGRHPRADPLPDRHPARDLGRHRRDPQQLRALHRPGAHARGVEPRDHRRPPHRRSAGGLRGGRAVRLRRLDRAWNRGSACCFPCHGWPAATAASGWRSTFATRR